MSHSRLTGAGVVAIALFATGCTSSSSNEVQQTVFARFGAASQNDCARLRMLSLAPADSDLCASVRADNYSSMPSVYEVDVKIDGDRALARVASGGSGRQITLLRVGDTWRVVYPLRAFD